jgi:predicted metal-dependent hydrolase
MEKQSITFNGKIIEFEIIRKKVKNINLNVKPDMTITVSVSKEVPISYIEQFVRKKAIWILKNVSYFEDTQPYEKLEREYVNGESYKYLGKQYRLKVFESYYEYVKYYRGFICLYVKNKNDFIQKEKLINNWFRKRIEIVAYDSLEKNYDLVKKYYIDKPKISFRLMKARWGSCFIEKKEIILNYDLIKAPKYCIDYVLLHELIHFKYENHDDNFYNFLTVLMPDWKKRKEILDLEVVKLL